MDFRLTLLTFRADNKIKSHIKNNRGRLMVSLEIKACLSYSKPIKDQEREISHGGIT